MSSLIENDRVRIIIPTARPAVLYYYFFFTDTHTHAGKSVADRSSPSPTKRFWHPEKATRNFFFFLQYNICFFPTISKRSKAQKWFTPIENKNKKQRRHLQIVVPCCNPPQMEKRLTLTGYKNITIFIYQIASVGSCSGIHIYLL